MKEIQVSTWCDVCRQDEVYTPGESTPPISLSTSGKAKTLDLCEAHRKELIDPLASLLKAVGVAVERPEPSIPYSATRKAQAPSALVKLTPGPFECKVPGCEAPLNPPNGGKGFKNLGSLQSHLRLSHQMKLTAYRREYGDPLEDREQPGEEETLDIPVGDEAQVCGIDGCQVSYSPERYNRPAQALGLHRWRAHGIRTTRKAS